MTFASIDRFSIAAAREGLQQGAGPFWDASQFCGHSLFGTWGQPWSSPMSLFILGPGRLFLIGLALLGLFLLWAQGAKRPWSLVFAFVTVIFSIGMPVGYLAGLAVAPWVLLSFWAAPFIASVACLSIFLTVLSPLLTVAALGLAYLEKPQWKLWGQRLGWSLIVASPAWLPTLLASTFVFERGAAWPVAAPSEWAAAVAWSCAALGLRLPKRSGPVLAIGCLGLIGMVAVSFPRKNADAPANPRPLPFNQAYSRYLDRDGSPETLNREVDNLLSPISLVGSLEGRGTPLAISRWQRLTKLGKREPDLLSLSNVGWIASEKNGQGENWNRPVSVALVDSAVANGDSGVPVTSLSLFERPLGIVGPLEKFGQGNGWLVLSPEGSWGSQIHVNVPTGHHGAWIFFSQSYDVGWETWAIDSQGARQRLPIMETEGGFMAVPLETGVQSMVFQFRPPFFWWGIVFSFLTLALMAWKDRAFLFERR